MNCCRRVVVGMVVFACTGTWPTLSTAGEAYPIAGLAPHTRPIEAPAITTFDRTPQWRANALKGVSEPYPSSLGFLDNQGAWYTPFTRPGMPAPYDLRGLHAANPAAAASPLEKNK